MTHSTADYEQSIAYADKVISSKDTYYRANYSDNVNISNNSDIYHLYDGSEAFQRIFVRGNSLESILVMRVLPIVKNIRLISLMNGIFGMTPVS